MDTSHRVICTALCLFSATVAAEPDGLLSAQGGEFTIYVTETAQLDARRSVTIASDLPSDTAKIAWLIDDGSRVAAGDTLVRFDPEPFRETAEHAERELEDARAQLMQAEAEMQIQVRQRQEQLDALKHQIALLELKLKNFDDVDRKLRLASAQHDIDAARATYRRLQLEADTQKELSGAGLGSDGLIAQARNDAAAAKSALALAEQTYKGLKEVGLPLEREQMTRDRDAKQRERQAFEAISLHGLAKQRAVITGVENHVAALAAMHERALSLLEKTEIKAPVVGLVSYVPVSVGNAFRRVQVGDSVWSRHGFMTIPDMSALTATVWLREVDVGKVAPGQQVLLKPDAFPGLQLTGRVSRIGGAKADAAGNRFEIRIAVDRTDARLRPAMRARAEILVHHYDDVVHVPVESVFRDRGESVCFVVNDGRVERRVVALGDSDGKYIVVLDGVAAGERLTLEPRTTLAAR